MSAKDFKSLLVHIKANKIPCSICLNSTYEAEYRLYGYHTPLAFEIKAIEDDYLIIEAPMPGNLIAFVRISEIAQIIGDRNISKNVF